MEEPGGTSTCSVPFFLPTLALKLWGIGHQRSRNSSWERETRKKNNSQKKKSEFIKGHRAAPSLGHLNSGFLVFFPILFTGSPFAPSLLLFEFFQPSLAGRFSLGGLLRDSIFFYWLTFRPAFSIFVSP